MDGRVCVGFSRDCGDLVGCSTGSRACVKHSMEGRDFVEAQWVIVHSRDAGDYLRGSIGGRDHV